MVASLQCSRMKRTIFRISLALLLGVVTSVAVAWGCACAWRPYRTNVTWRSIVPVPPSWPEYMQNAGLQQPTTALVERFRVATVRYTKGDFAGRWVGLSECYFGVPFRAMRWEAVRASRGLDTGPFVDHVPDWRRGIRVGNLQAWLPLVPHWPGLLANTALYGSAWALLLFGPGIIRRMRRRRAGRCVKCGYDLRGSTSTSCPECGHADND